MLCDRTVEQGVKMGTGELGASEHDINGMDYSLDIYGGDTIAPNAKGNMASETDTCIEKRYTRIAVNIEENNSIYDRY